MNDDKSTPADSNLDPAGDRAPQTPADAAETARLPEHPATASAPDAATADAANAANTADTATQGAAKGRRRRNLLIGAGAVVALLAVGGGAYAVGANVGDDPDDDDRTAVSGDAQPGGADRGDRDPDDRNDRDDRRDGDSADRGGADQGSSTAELPPADADALREAATAAMESAGATGITSIDVERGGYEVEVVMPDGSQPDVFVAVDGETTTGRDRPEEDADPTIDLDRLSDIVAAALDASESASGATGTIDSISASDDPGPGFEVSIRLADGRDSEIDLDADLGVVRTDVDDD